MVVGKWLLVVGKWLLENSCWEMVIRKLYLHQYFQFLNSYLKYPTSHFAHQTSHILTPPLPVHKLWITISVWLFAMFYKALLQHAIDFNRIVMPKHGKKKPRKIKFFKKNLKIPEGQNKMLRQFCKENQTTENKVFRKALREYIQNSIPPVVHINPVANTNQLCLFDFSEEDDKNMGTRISFLQLLDWDFKKVGRQKSGY